MVKKGNKNHIKVVFGDSLDEMNLGGVHKWCHVLAPIKAIAETHKEGDFGIRKLLVSALGSF